MSEIDPFVKEFKTIWAPKGKEDAFDLSVDGLILVTLDTHNAEIAIAERLKNRHSRKVEEMTITDPKDIPVGRLLADIVKRHYHPCGSVNSAAPLLGDLRELIAEVRKQAAQEQMEKYCQAMCGFCKHDIFPKLPLIRRINTDKTYSWWHKDKSGTWLPCQASPIREQEEK